MVSGFQQIKHHLLAGSVEGDYSGYVVKFDWSGKYIISQAQLKLSIKRTDQTLTGKWEEDGQQEPASLTGTITDSAVVFSNSTFNQLDHYHLTKPLVMQFVDAHFNLTKINDTVYLSGTPLLYSPQIKEPQKPEFIMLIRTGALGSDSDFLSNNNTNTTKTDSLHFIAYPNPFTNALQLRYTLKKAANVSIMISNLQTGAIVYRASPGNLQPGDHTTPVSFNGSQGNYIITLQYGNNVKSAIVFKQ